MVSSKSKNSKLWGFVVLSVLVIGYAVADFYWDKKAEDQKSKEALLLNWNPDQIDQITWSEGPEKIRLVRSTEGWSFEEPIKEKADSDSVNTFVEGIVLEKSTTTVVEGPNIDPKTFGLDIPKAVIRIRKNSGEEKQFAISSKKNISGETYLQVVGEAKVLLVSSTWQQKAEKRSLDFRDRRWARLAAANIDKVKLAKGNASFELEIVDGSWFLTLDKKLKIDQNKVRKLLADMTSHQVTGFTPKAETAPMATLSLSLKDQTQWIGEFSITKEKKHLLHVKGTDLTMELAPQDAEDIYKLGVDELRDRSEPFQVRRDDVKKIELNLDNKTWNLALQNEHWVALPGSTEKIVNEGLLRSLLDKVSGLQVTSFDNLPAVKSGKLNRMKLMSADDKILLELSLQGPQEQKMNGLSKTVFVAKSNQVQYGFTLAESEWLSLDWPAVLTPANASTNKGNEKK